MYVCMYAFLSPKITSIIVAVELSWVYHTEHILLYCFLDCSMKLSIFIHLVSQVVNKMSYGKTQKKIFCLFFIFILERARERA